METKELTNSTQDQIAVLENLNVEDSKQSESTAIVEIAEELRTVEVKDDAKKQSAADLILQRLGKAKTQTDTKEVTVNEVQKPVVKQPEKVVVPKVENAPVKLSEQAELLLVDDEHSEEEHHEVEIDEINEETEAPSTLVNYADYSRKELVTMLKELLGSRAIQEIKNDVESIKTNYYKKLKAEAAETKRKFVEAGGDLAEFKVDPDTNEVELKELYNKYKEARNQFNANIEKQKSDNLKAKYQIIDEIKALLNGNETLNKTFHEFKDLQRRWREIGIVPQAEVKALWDNYNYYVEKFYDFVNINKELRDLDLRRNMEAKIGLCERAEEQLIEPMIVKAFKTLQKLHAQWREIGPVPNEKKDEIWERFKEATTTINKKYQDHFEKIKLEQENNLNAKTLLCEKAEELASIPVENRKDWEKNSDEILELQKIWKRIGFAPKKDNNKIYSRFRNACDVFFSKKRDFFSQHKENLDNNMQMKTDLCVQAETLIDSTDWKKTTDIYINLQKTWKTIGPVPRKYSDPIWNRFRAACNAFFEKKSSHFATVDAEQDKNLQLKRDLIERAKAFEFTDDNGHNIDELKEIQKEWSEIGHVPIQFKDELQHQFREVLNGHFNKIHVDDHKRNETRFRNKLESIQNSPKAYEKLRAEKEKIRDKIEQLQSDIVLWENNIGFFAKSKNADSMIKEFHNKIDNAKDKVKEFKKQLDLMERSDKE